MDLQSIIENYGYAAVLIGTFGALVWAVAVASGGFLFGRAREIFIGKLKSYEIYIMGSVAIVGLLIWIFHFFRRRRRRAEFIAKSL